MFTKILKSVKQNICNMNRSRVSVQNKLYAEVNTPNLLPKWISKRSKSHLREIMIFNQ